tara:strand:+ start:224 stop:694 length:471 start_codon:yes stop_codon:yes gene_type:complete
MARITVEDCLEKIDSQYDLVLLAKERTLQLNAGEKALVPTDNDKNTVLSLREIGDGKVSPKIIKDLAINRLRKIKSVPEESEDLEIDQLDDFDKIYKGEISKSGAAILPSKRSRRISEKITSVRDTVVKDDETKKIIEQTDQEAENESISADNKTE